jgi:hypothetical protein
VLRILSGMISSVTIGESSVSMTYTGIRAYDFSVANFGGAIADLWNPHGTGPAMSVFLWGSTCKSPVFNLFFFQLTFEGGAPSGYFFFAFVAVTHGFRDIFWALLGICGGFWLIMALTIRETRHNVLLARKDRREHRNTGDFSLPRTQGIMNALKRPFVFLATESIVQFAAAYSGYFYGLSYFFNSAFIRVFGPEDHAFGTISIGLCFLVIVVETIIGPITNALF